MTNAAGPNNQPPNIDQIIKAVRTAGGDISPNDYAKFIQALKDFGFSTKTERPHGKIQVALLVEKLKEFSGTNVEMIAALRAGNVKLF